MFNNVNGSQEQCREAMTGGNDMRNGTMSLARVARALRRSASRAGRLAAATAVTLCLISTPGAAAPAASIRVEKAWARPGLAAYMSAAYMVITNEGRTADRLVAAETGVAWTVEIHQTVVEGGVARMQKVSGVEIPPGATTELKPGGYHLMLIGLRRDLVEKEKFPIVLVFKEAGRINVTAEIRMSGR